jgi:hypothetical protein
MADRISGLGNGRAMAGAQFTWALDPVGAIVQPCG